MPDIALIATANPLTGFPSFDIALTEAPAGAEAVAVDVETDSGLNTAVYLSLFTDARADPTTVLDASDLRGWWGDEFGEIGSLLWQLTRGKATDEAVSNAGVWAEQSLAWLVASGVAQSVIANASRIGLYAISIVIQIARPSNTTSTFRYALNWAATG